MIPAGTILLLAFALSFSRCERRLWGSARTPFAFAVYPSVLTLAVAALVAPSLGFLALHAATILVVGLFIVLVAASSLAMRSVGGPNVSRPAKLETVGAGSPNDPPERAVSRVEYVVLGLLLSAFFVSTLLGGVGSDVEKGELGVGGPGGHLIELGIAYLVLALSQRRGNFILRGIFTVLMLWILAFNQVKYLIVLPIAAALLYRWVSRQLSTSKLVIICLTLPLVIVVVIYAYFGVAAASTNASLTPTLVAELAKHMIAYLVSGTLGLDRLLLAGKIEMFRTDGLAYALAPFVNVARFVAGTGHYVDVVNPLYLIIHQDGVLDSNVFTLFGSLLYRGGWVTAVGLTLGYASVSYWIWSRWRTKRGSIDCAVGSWWLAALLLAWFDLFYMHLSVVEVMAFLWIRGLIARFHHVRNGLPVSALPGPVSVFASPE
jgi:hypothetical protein